MGFVSGVIREKRIARTSMTFVVSRPCNTPPGFPIPGSLPFGKGRGSSYILASEGGEELRLSPHPSEEGRGSNSGCCLWLGMNRGSEGEVVVEEEQGRVNQNQP